MLWEPVICMTVVASANGSHSTAFPQMTALVGQTLNIMPVHGKVNGWNTKHEAPGANCWLYILLSTGTLCENNERPLPRRRPRVSLNRWIHLSFHSTFKKPHYVSFFNGAVEWMVQVYSHPAYIIGVLFSLLHWESRERNRHGSACSVDFFFTQEENVLCLVGIRIRCIDQVCKTHKELTFPVTSASRGT